jgi:ubiquinone/menaquinone biosynthesis C-methylase UbiE
MNSYDRFARLYDLEHKDFLEDIDLYRNFSMRCNGPVLELGCGSGRVALALAQAGMDVVGIDISEAMLALARTHAEEQGLLDKVRLEWGDMRALAFQEAFALVLCPLNGFLHLETAQDQQAALDGIHRALLPGGFLLVDVSNPHTVFTPDLDGQLVFRRQLDGPEGTGLSIWAMTRTDLAPQVQNLTLVYDRVDGAGLVHRTTVDTKLRFVYRYEMEGLLRRSGFKLDAVYGTYDLDPYESDSHVMLFVAHK